ncbi:MAG: hypothetical protein JXQ66_05305 [Campylobacterales bacterium]|nr:hypothetical protein [Campylobacterales bacterium]
MKIVDRLYIKVLIIAAILIVAIVLFYTQNTQSDVAVVAENDTTKKIQNGYIKELKELRVVKEELKKESELLVVAKNEYKKEIDAINKSYIDEIERLKGINEKYTKKVDAISQQMPVQKQEVLVVKEIECDEVKDDKSEIVASNEMLKRKYEMMIMKNIHNQVIEELKYAPYLLTSQLQEKMERRFVLDDLSFMVSICNDTNESFDGVVIDDKKIRSITDAKRLVEVSIAYK